MDPLHNPTPDPQTDLALLLPRDAFYQVMLILRGALPPPGSGKPEDWVRRDRAAMAAVVALRPINAAEGRLAAQFVMADCWAADCLREAAERRPEMKAARQCLAGALSFLRESKSSLKALVKLQAERQVLDKDEAASDRAAWTEHGIASMMNDALAPAADAGPALLIADAARVVSAGDVGEFRLAPVKATMNRHQRRETAARRSKLSRASAADIL